jgi:gamma-glutamylcysteine synthetase
VSIDRKDAVKAVNVLNGFAGAQLSLTANSPVAGEWLQGSTYKCHNEKFWDWWEPVKERVGVPTAPFANLEEYVARIADLKPIYAKRDGMPILLCHDYGSLADYLRQEKATGRTPEGEKVAITPDETDIATHNSCYWYTARISRYYTVENRVFDQQPRAALLAPAALTLGLVEAIDEAWEEVSSHDWEFLRQTREEACRHGMDWTLGTTSGPELAGRMLEIAERGLKRRGHGEEDYLEPMRQRVGRRECPADRAKTVFASESVPGLLSNYALT